MNRSAMVSKAANSSVRACGRASLANWYLIWTSPRVQNFGRSKPEHILRRSGRKQKMESSGSFVVAKINAEGCGDVPRNRRQKAEGSRQVGTNERTLLQAKGRCLLRLASGGDARV